MLVLYESDFSVPGSMALLSALEVDAPDAVLTVLDRRLPPRTIARLSGEGRLIDLDPTIGGSLGGRRQKINHVAESTDDDETFRGEIERGEVGGETRLLGRPAGPASLT